MPDLIVHIGFPKTGTTTIQERILSGKQGYLGKSNEHSKEREELFKELKRISRIEFSSSQNLKYEVVKRGKKLINNAFEYWPDSRCLIASDEFFTNHQIGGINQIVPIGKNKNQLQALDHGMNRPIVQFLKEINEKVLNDGKVKVVLVLRNQPEWLGSVYSQMSSNLPSASQRDFENEINDLIENQEDYLKWSLWVEDLQIALGEENVCTLLMEEMNQATFWKQLFGFMEIDDINPEEMIKLENTGENVKKTASNAWETISPQGSLKPLKKIVNEYWSRNKFPQARKIARNATRIYNRLVTRFNPRYDPQIQMTDELRRKVLDYCQASNAKLAEQLGRDDLKKLGY